MASILEEIRRDHANMAVLLRLLDEQIEILSSLESEKAYLTSRMTIEGQRKLCDIHKLKGGISVREVRRHLKDHQFDSSSS